MSESKSDVFDRFTTPQYCYKARFFSIELPIVRHAKTSAQQDLNLQHIEFIYICCMSLYLIITDYESLEVIEVYDELLQKLHSGEINYSQLGDCVFQNKDICFD